MNRSPKIVWLKKNWNLRQNPFPSEAIARLGADDLRENGMLFNPAVQPDKLKEAEEKFVLGAAYSGLKFGFLWSLGTGVRGDARGFGKSVTMQYLVEKVNDDFGESIFVQCGLDASDAEENPICAVLASFDMATARSLNAVFYEAARYACRFRKTKDAPTLAERIRERLVAKIGTDEQEDLIAAVEEVQASLRGRTLGPPEQDFLELLCGTDEDLLQEHVDGVTPTKRTRSGAVYLATFLLFVRAAGIPHVLLCCDQLEDFAATTTTKQKRTLETERFRDYILELQPMSDMLSCVVTMHPRATSAIGEMWRLADLPSYEHERAENRHRVVVLERIEDSDRAEDLIATYLRSFRSDGSGSRERLAPFTTEAVEAILTRSDGKPRDILRKAHALIERGAEENWDRIDGERAAKVLDTFVVSDDDVDGGSPSPASRSAMWSQ